MDIGTGLNKKYLTLFIDCVEFIGSAEIGCDHSAHSLYRASIISNVLAVECCANICIHHMNLPSDLYEQIEKMSVIAKFDYFSHNYFQKIIDRSLNEYSNLKSLLAVRNDYVHPKVEEGEFKEEYERCQFGNKKAFNLSNDIRGWNKENAVTLLNSHVKFMSYFLNDLCGFSIGQSNSLLTAIEDKISKCLHESWVEADDELIDALNKYLNVKMTYLDLRKRKQT